MSQLSTNSFFFQTTTQPRIDVHSQHRNAWFVKAHQSSEHNNGHDRDNVSYEDILAAAKGRDIGLHLDTFGPFFRVRALDLQCQELLGAAQGFVRPWIGPPILHLDSIRMKPASTKVSERPLLGLAFLLGAAAILHGKKYNCSKAELLAINDTDAIHDKLVRYYTRMGFKTVYNVTGDSLRDIPHMLIWGGVGTRMDANIEELLLKWTPTFNRCSAQK